MHGSGSWKLWDGREAGIPECAVQCDFLGLAFEEELAERKLLLDIIKLLGPKLESFKYF